MPVKADGATEAAEDDAADESESESDEGGGVRLDEEEDVDDNEFNRGEADGPEDEDTVSLDNVSERVEAADLDEDGSRDELEPDADRDCSDDEEEEEFEVVVVEVEGVKGEKECVDVEAEGVEAVDGVASDDEDEEKLSSRLCARLLSTFTPRLVLLLLRECMLYAK